MLFRKVPVWAWLAAAALVNVLLVLMVRVPSWFNREPSRQSLPQLWLLDPLIVMSAVVLLFLLVRAVTKKLPKKRSSEPPRNASEPGSRTMMVTSKEWLWAVDAAGIITHSSPMCQQLTGYTPEELTGSPISLVLDPRDLASVWRPDADNGAESYFDGVTLACRHRDGTRVVMDVSGHTVYDASGLAIGFEGLARPSTATGGTALDAERSLVLGVISSQALVTAFQPLLCIKTGRTLGVEALSRFPDAATTSPEAWFTRAETVGLGIDLELLALRTALHTATKLPGEFSLAVNLSPSACLDQRIQDALAGAAINPDRLSLELTERQEVLDYEQLAAAVAPLRAKGVHLVVDDAGAGFASMRHIMKLDPEVIKVDRSIIKGIDRQASNRALAASMVSFATEIGASVTAEGVETAAELQVITELGMSAAQGYFLGKPSTQPTDWIKWAGLPGS
ncbi:EAL domain-containing protein [Paenarthrobacter sp. A20]|uniref:sensor domain-containing phosphodiesterase n=1 Tax=Paenarthrobacter sp. A20 TaxID=2817891 RepID=UPI0020A1C84C|nr:EAL domain-containing protein [Paenarthrobacter sp. A20]MCP1411105.1 PAS domain S-box-containing protein [Paenarthrobacter sp. A20]